MSFQADIHRLAAEVVEVLETRRIAVRVPSSIGDVGETGDRTLIYAVDLDIAASESAAARMESGPGGPVVTMIEVTVKASDLVNTLGTQSESPFDAVAAPLSAKAEVHLDPGPLTSGTSSAEAGWRRVSEIRTSCGGELVTMTIEAA